jgi:hypothetical protein
MSIGAAFLIVIILVVFAVVGGGIYMTAAWLRHKQLDPEGDKIEPPAEDPPRPEHHAVQSEQRTRFVGTR